MASTNCRRYTFWHSRRVIRSFLGRLRRVKPNEHVYSLKAEINTENTINKKVKLYTSWAHRDWVDATDLCCLLDLMMMMMMMMMMMICECQHGCVPLRRTCTILHLFVWFLVFILGIGMVWIVNTVTRAWLERHVLEMTCCMSSGSQVYLFIYLFIGMLYSSHLLCHGNEQQCNERSNDTYRVTHVPV